MIIILFDILIVDSKTIAWWT